MVEIGMLFGLLGTVGLVLVLVLVRRGNGATENADGLHVERQRLLQTQQDRVRYSSGMARDTRTGAAERHHPW